MTATIPRRSRYDAIVVGARVAGAATAMLLARGGLDVLLVDRQPYGSDTLSTHALMRGAVIQLARWGLVDRLVAAGTPAIRSTTFRYGEESITVAIKPGDGVEALYAPRRTVLDPILVDAAWDAGVEVHHDTAFLDVIRGAGGRVRGAVIRDAVGVVHEVMADIVIGADGISSRVARQACADILEASTVSSATLYACVPDPGLSGYHWIYGLGASACVIPTNGGEAVVALSMTTGRYDREVHLDRMGGFRRILGGLDPALTDHAAACGLASLSVFRGRAGYIRRAHGPGWALVGDAGFFRDPHTAHGITDALKDAEALAAAVLEGTPAAHAKRAAERDSAARRIMAVTDAIASYAWSLAELKEHHRTLSAFMKDEVAALTARRDMDRMPERAVA